MTEYDKNKLNTVIQALKNEFLIKDKAFRNYLHSHHNSLFLCNRRAKQL